MSRQSGRIAAVLSLCVLVAACSPSSPASTSSSGPTGPTPAPTPVAVDPTSEELIAAALDAGSIAYEDSLLYRTLALYDSAGLPDQFKSKVPDMHAAGELFGEIHAKKASLSASTLAKLAPYTARPADPVSIFNAQPAVTSAAGAALGAIAPMAPAAPAASTWKNDPAAGGKVRVWMAESAGDQARADRVAAVDQVWAAYPGIFTYPIADSPKVPSAEANPDGAIDIYFVNVGALDPRRPECTASPSTADCVYVKSDAGYAQRAEPYTAKGSASGYVVIDASSGGDDLLDTLAHEIAHTAQYAYDEGETSWLYESTATWVAYRVMKKLGKVPTFEYDLLGQTFYGLDKTLTRPGKRTAYASWLYFLFAQMEKGDGVVIDVWKAAATPGVQGADAVDKVLPFEPKYADYALRDWNQDPVKPMYSSADSSFPDGYWPAIRNSVRRLAGGKEDALKVDLPPLASAYFEYSFEDSARAVTFENNLAGVPNAHVWGIATIKGGAKPPEDWSALTKKRFCRDAPEQDLTEVVIVVTNTSLTNPLQVSQPPRIKGDAKGCIGWTGTMKGTYWWSAGGYSGTSTGTFSGTWVVDDKRGCSSDSGDCIRFIPDGTISWTWDSSGYIGQEKCHQTASGSLAAVDRFGLGDQQYLHLTVVDSNHYRYWGQGNYYLAKGVQDSITCFGFIGDTSNNYPPPFFSLDEGSSKSNPVVAGGGDTCFAADWVIDAKATTITGSCYGFKTPRNYEQFEWNLTRLGPPPGS